MHRLRRILALVGAFLASVALLWWWAKPLDSGGEPPRTLAEAEQQEREIMAGTRVGRSLPGERAEAAEMALQKRQRAEAEQPIELYRHCQNAVRRDLLLSSNVVVDDGNTPPSGELAQWMYRDIRHVAAMSSPTGMPDATPLATPLSGAYDVHGTVRSGSADRMAAEFRVYDCSVLAKPPLYLVTSVTVRTAR